MKPCFTDQKIQYYKDVKSPLIGFVELDKLTLKYLSGNANGPFDTEVLFKKGKENPTKQSMRGLVLPNSSIYLKAIMIKAVLFIQRKANVTIKQNKELEMDN